MESRSTHVTIVMARRVVLALCLFAAWVADPAAASWRPLKPIFGGGVYRIAEDAGGTLYISTGGGLFKSSDDGQSWTPANGNLPTPPAGGPIATDPSTAGWVYVWTDQGLYRTTDGGDTWTRLLTLPGGVYVTEIAVAPSNRNYIFAATWGSYVWRSLDLGATWTQSTSGLFGGWGGPSFITSMAVDPTNENRVYTSTWRGQLFRSDNAAASWYAMGGGGTWANGQIYVSRSNPAVLYTTHDEYWFGRGTVLKSTNYGDAWSNAGRPTGSASDAYQLSIDPDDANIVFAADSQGLHRTTTGGGAWSLTFSAPSGLKAMASVWVDDDDASRVFGGSYYSGFYRSLDAGGMWTQHNTGVAAATVTGIGISRDFPSTIYAGAQTVGYLKSTDGGETWMSIGTAQGLQDHYLGGLGVHPENPDILITSTSDCCQGRIWRTIDGGTTFTAEAIGYGSGWFRFNPHTPNTVHTSVSDWQGGFLYSNDTGDNWYVPYWWYIYPGNYDFHPTLANVVFSLGNQYTGAPLTTVWVLWSSSGTGSSWTGSPFGQGQFSDLALDQNSPSTLYVAGRIPSEGTQGIYKFTVSYSGSSVVSVSRVPGTFNSGLTSTGVRRILYDRATGFLYASTPNGVFRSSDQAASWVSISDGLPYRSADVMATTPDGKRLLVGTNGGIWEYVDNQTPVADAGDDQAVECTGPSGAEVTLDGRGSSDQDGDTLTFTWTGPFGTATGESVAVTLPLGTHTITLTVDDGKGGTATDTVEITVEDTTAPSLSVTLSPSVLWPPNHRLVAVIATVQVADACDPSPVIELVSVVSNEPDNGSGDGDLPGDVQDAAFGTADLAFLLRAERAGSGTGRVYTVTYRAADASGNVTVASATVSVPHDRRK